MAEFSGRSCRQSFREGVVGMRSSMVTRSRNFLKCSEKARSSCEVFHMISMVTGNPKFLEVFGKTRTQVSSFIGFCSRCGVG